jgi:hypothetical protein
MVEPQQQVKLTKEANFGVSTIDLNAIPPGPDGLFIALNDIMLAAQDLGRYETAVSIRGAKAPVVVIHRTNDLAEALKVHDVAVQECREGRREWLDVNLARFKDRLGP